MNKNKKSGNRLKLKKKKHLLFLFGSQPRNCLRSPFGSHALPRSRSCSLSCSRSHSHSHCYCFSWSNSHSRSTLLSLLLLLSLPLSLSLLLLLLVQLTLTLYLALTLTHAPATCPNLSLFLSRVRLVHLIWVVQAQSLISLAN